MDLEY